MGVEKPGITVLEQCAKYAKACDKSGILCTKPVHIQSVEGLRYAHNLTEDVVQLNRTGVKTDTVINKLMDISRIEVIPNANKRALTAVEHASKNASPSSRDAIMWLFSPDAEFALKNYSHPDEYIKSISKILDETKGLEYKEFISILERLSKQLEELAISTAKEFPLTGMKGLEDTKYRYNAVQNIKDKQSILKKIIQEMRTEKMDNNETFSNYFERLYAKLKTKPRENIRVKYNDIDVPPEKIVLSSNEKEEFKRICLEHNGLFNKELTPNMTFEEIADYWCRARVMHYVQDAEKLGTSRMQMAALQTLPRYSGEIGADGQIKPLVRWLHKFKEKMPSKPVYNPNQTEAMNNLKFTTYPRRLEEWKNYDLEHQWIDETFKIGETYSYPKMQSTSTSLTWSEGVFRDDNPGMNVKFIIHPRSKTSKAYYMGSKSLGDGEAVYLPDTKFTVLDKRVERAEDSVGNIFYRHIIEMQEL